MKKTKILGIITAILLLFSLLFMTSCMGGSSSSLDDGDEKYGDEKYPEDDPKKDPFDNGGETEEEPDKSDGNKPNKEDEKIDLSAVDVSKFKIVYRVYDTTTDIYANTDVYLGMYTENLFNTSVNVYFTYDGIDEFELESKIIDSIISVSEERVTNDMTFFLSADQATAIAAEYVDDISESNFERCVEVIIEKVTDKEIRSAQLEEFIENTFTYADFTKLVTDTISGEIELATSESTGYAECAAREAKSLSLEVEGTYSSWNNFEYGALVPWESFNATVEDFEWYYTDYIDWNSEYLDFTFDGYENRELIKSFGFNYTDDGVIADDKFYDIMNKNSDLKKFGMITEHTLECPDGTEQTIVFEHYIDSYERVYYDITTPATASAPLDFENGMTYTFEVTVCGVPYTVTCTTRNSVIEPRDYYTQLSTWISKCGELKGSSYDKETKLTFTAPDSAVFTVTDVPINSYMAGITMQENGVFAITYGDRTTTLTPATESCCGISYDSVYSYIKVVDNNKILITELQNRKAGVQDSPHLVDCYSTKESWGATLYFTASISFKPTIESRTISSYDAIGRTYYIGDEVYIAPGAMLNINGIDSFGGETYLIKSVPITKDMIDNFTTTEEGDSFCLYVKYEDGVTAPIYYTVKKDFITSIKVNVPAMLDVYIIGAPYSFKEFTIDATYESGKEEKGIKVSEDLISAMPSTTGEHTMTVTYQGQTDTFKLKALKAKEVRIESGLGKYYIKGEKPTEAVIYVKFETNSFGYDYDYVIVGEEVLSSFNTDTVGNASWSYSYAGITISHTYEVKEGAYVVYTVVGEESVTINGIVMTKDEIPEDASYYEIKSFSELIIPATLSDLPVTKIGSRAFEGLNMITKVVIPEGVTEIGAYAFKDASGIKEVMIPFSAMTIGTKIFAGCTNIERMTVNGNLKIESYFDKELPTALTVAFNEGVTTLTERCLTITADGYTIKKVIFPSTLTTIEYGESPFKYEVEYAFRDVESFECTAGGYFSASDGVLFTDGGKTLYYYPINKKDASYTIPEGTEKVLFMGQNLNIKSVVIPASVKELGDGVFAFNENMTTVKFEGSLNALPDCAFEYCSSLTTFNFPSGIKAIGEYALSYTAIPTVVVPDGVTTIGSFAFYMSKIQKLAIPASAIDSFAELSYQCMNSLTDFAYDGSYQIKSLKAIFDSFTRDALKNIYVYDATSFKGGITAGSRSYTIYIDESVKTIEYYDYEFSGNKYYYAGSSITNNSSNKNLTTNSSFNQWYEKG